MNYLEWIERFKALAAQPLRCRAGIKALIVDSKFRQAVGCTVTCVHLLEPWATEVDIPGEGFVEIPCNSDSARWLIKAGDEQYHVIKDSDLLPLPTSLKCSLS